PDGQHTHPRGPPGSRQGPGATSLLAVHRAAGATGAERSSSARRGLHGGVRRPFDACRRDRTGGASMTALPALSSATALDRRARMLRTAMGPLIAGALDDPDVLEIMLNPDGQLWVDRLSSGREPLGTLSASDGERIIRLVAAHVGGEVHRSRPLLSAELPETGERFEGVLPPVSVTPAFALRKRARRVITLEQYERDGILTPA